MISIIMHEKNEKTKDELIFIISLIEILKIVLLIADYCHI